MKDDFDNTIFLIFALLAIAAAVYIFGGHQAFGQSPTAIIAPNGQITYVYPSTSPTAPVTIISPSGQPTLVYPGIAPGAPATIISPTGQPSFAYPSLLPAAYSTMPPAEYQYER